MVTFVPRDAAGDNVSFAATRRARAPRAGSCRAAARRGRNRPAFFETKDPHAGGKASLLDGTDDLIDAHIDLLGHRGDEIAGRLVPLIAIDADGAAVALARRFTEP